MAIFRVEKTKGYTVMSNHHLQNKSLSLKAKGLLSLMLSLPDDWDYTLKGLTFISKEGTDAIREGVRELECAGYIIRSRLRNENGQLAGAEYVIYEQPQSAPAEQAQTGGTPPHALQDEPVKHSPVLEKPILEKPTLDYPTQVYPTQENPILDNPMQLITNVIKTYPEKKNQSNIHPSNPDRIRIDLIEIERIRREIRQRIDYYSLVEDPQESNERLNEIVELMVEIQCSTKPAIRIAGDDYPVEMLKERFAKLTGKHIEYVTSCLRHNTSRVRNIKQYLLTTLFNAPATVENFYSAEFNHLYYGGGT